MNIQQARKPAAKVKVTGRPLWGQFEGIYPASREETQGDVVCGCIKAVPAVRATSARTRGVALAAKPLSSVKFPS